MTATAVAAAPEVQPVALRRIYRFELVKLTSQWRLRLVFLACLVAPGIYTAVVSAQTSLPADAVYGRWMNQSGWAGSLVILVFIMTPITPATVIVFSFCMGLLWLTTVPLTSGLVATMFGTKNMGTLYGFVFLSHQIGSFTGIYMGGVTYDLYGNYNAFWYAAIALGIFSAIVHLPVQDRAWTVTQPA